MQKEEKQSKGSVGEDLIEMPKVAPDAIEQSLNC